MTNDMKNRPTVTATPCAAPLLAWLPTLAVRSATQACGIRRCWSPSTRTSHFGCREHEWTRRPAGIPTRLLLSLAVSVYFGGAAYSNSANLATSALPAKGTFVSHRIAEFNAPWAIAFLPDQRLLVTEESGRMYLVLPEGTKIEVRNVPRVDTSRGDGLLDVAVPPDFAKTSQVFFTYIEADSGRLVLARATLASSGASASLSKITVVWRQNVAGGGVHTGGVIAFDPKGTHLFLTVGDFQQPETAQDPKLARGKVLRINVDGSTPSDNPNAAAGGIQAQTWTTGHRNPYGLAFSADGRLWLNEMGPFGGDELNLILPGRNYGWPKVSEGAQYSGSTIPKHATQPQFAAPLAYWTPVISPAGLAFYRGTMFPHWQGSALIGGLSARSLVRVSFGRDGEPVTADRWDMGARIRDVAIASDGAVWVIEDGTGAKLIRITRE
jgi:glucose/arabinose dehydrogenase